MILEAAPAELFPVRVAAYAAAKAAVEWSVANGEPGWANEQRWYQAFDRVMADFAADETRAASFDDAEFVAAGAY
jgi:hypothetical protein